MGSQASELPDQHRADVQGLRALAVTLVVVYHAGLPLPGGYVGVDVFFVISGYVIVRSLLNHWAADKTNLLDFYLRRARRLLPAFLLAASATLFLSIFFTSYDARTQAFETARAGALFSSNLQLMLFRANSYFTSTEQANPLLHTWSLSLEEQIYFIAPIILFLVYRLARGTSTTKTVVLAIFVTGIAFISLLASYSFTYARGIWPIDSESHLVRGLEASRMIAFYSPFTRVWEFLVGALIAILGVRLRGWVGRILFVAGVSAIACASFLFDSGTAFPGLPAIVPVMGTAAMILGTELRIGKHSMLESRPAGWIGDRSYSIYLWHWPMIQFAKATFPDLQWASLASLAISIPLAALAFRFVEQPIRHNRTISSKKWASGLTAIVCTSSLFGVASVKALEPTPELQTHDDVTSKCVSTPFDAILSSSICIWPLPGAKRDALLVGDSQAGHITEAFITAAHTNGLNARVVTRTGAFMNNPERDYVANLIAQSPTIDVVVVGQLTFDGDLFADWEPLINGFLGTITESGKKVVFLHRIQKGGEPLKCATVRLLLDEHACELPGAESLASRDYVRTMKKNETAVLATLSGVSGFDPNPFLCKSYPCPSQQEEGWLWRDPSHLSRRAADRLTEPLADAIRRSLAK